MKFSAAVWLFGIIVIGKTPAIGYPCYGGGEKVKSPKNNDMYVLDGVNGTCIAAMVGQEATFREAKQLCNEEFPNGGQLMLKENKDILFSTWKRYSKVTTLGWWFWVGYGETTNDSCTIVQPSDKGTVGGPDVCEWPSRYFICQYPLNYDCYMETSDPTINYTTCELVYNFLWQPSDLNHNKICTGRKSVNSTQEFCNCSKMENGWIRDYPWSSWTSCSKTCAGGKQTRSRNLSCHNFLMDDTWVKSYHTNIPCEVAISSDTSSTTFTSTATRFTYNSSSTTSSVSSTTSTSIPSSFMSTSSTVITSTSIKPSSFMSTFSTVTTATSIESSSSASPSTTTVPPVEISTNLTSTISNTTSNESSFPSVSTNCSSAVAYTSTVPTSVVDSSTTISSTNYLSTTMTISSNSSISQSFSLSDDHFTLSTFITDGQASSTYLENDTADQASSTFLENRTVHLFNETSTVSEERSKDTFKDGFIITIVVALGVLGLFFMICGSVLMCSKKNRKGGKNRKISERTDQGIESVKSPYCSTQESSTSSSSP